MTSDELALKVAKIHAEALTRIRVQGRASYGSEEASAIPFGQSEPVVVGLADEFQRFDTESMEDNLNGLEEELLDTINWAAMAVIKLRERRAKANRNA